jgi:hypothetical protein
MALIKVVTRLPGNLAASVHQAAAADGVSVSEWIRHLVRQEDHRRNGTGPTVVCVARVVHLLREDFSHACGQDDRGYSSGVLAEVTCTACKEVA